MFRDRTDAGRQLARRLTAYRDRHPRILALPRGGVPVAFEIAQALRAPLDLLMVRKIGAPGQPELALGAVAEGDPPFVRVNDDIVDIFAVSDLYIQTEVSRLAADMQARRRMLGGSDRPVRMIGQTIILVDDGIATGATVRVAVAAMRAAQAHHICVAAPVMPPEVVAMLSPEVDALVALEMPTPFRAVGCHYEDFTQVSDTQVAALMADAAGGA